MAINSSSKLRVGYAGTLMGYQPKAAPPSSWMRSIKQWFWTYHSDLIDKTTRSGYYLMQGVAKLQQEQPELAEQLLFHFWGNISTLNEHQAQSLGIGHLFCFEGFKSKAETVEQLRSCDVLFLPLESGKGSQRPLFIPGKLYEYLKLGRPILALAGPSDCRDILQESNLGITCSPKDPNEIARVLARLVTEKEDLAKKYRPNQAYITENFDMRNQSHRLAAIFDEVLAKTETA